MNQFNDQDPNGIINPSMEELIYVQKGVLWVQKEPHYIVELIKENNVSYVMVYDVHKDTKANPQKATKSMPKKENLFVGSTVLGKLANKLIRPQKNPTLIPKDPLFVAPVMPDQKATLTGKIESGFFERESDKFLVIGGEKKLQRGSNTGVFIGLSSIVWEERVTVPTESLVKALIRQKQDMFYDLEGENDNSDNPLSTYYKNK